MTLLAHCAAVLNLSHTLRHNHTLQHNIRIETHTTPMRSLLQRTNSTIIHSLHGLSPGPVVCTTHKIRHSHITATHPQPQSIFATHKTTHTKQHSTPPWSGCLSLSLSVCSKLHREGAPIAPQRCACAQTLSIYGRHQTHLSENKATLANSLSQQGATNTPMTHECTRSADSCSPSRTRRKHNIAHRKTKKQMM